MIKEKKLIDDEAHRNSLHSNGRLTDGVQTGSCLEEDLNLK
jgi:hypothetical protein